MSFLQTTLIIVVLVVPCHIRALVLTEYLKFSPLSSIDLVPCGQKASAFDYCACRVDDTSCEPLTTDWCKTQAFEPFKAYLIKRVVTETLQSSLIFNYERKLPIYIRENSSIKLKFTLQSGWSSLAVELMDEQTNIVLHVNLRVQDELVLNACINGVWGTEETKLGYGRYTTSDVQRTLKILDENNRFLVYLDGSQEMTFNKRLLTTSINGIKVYFGTVQGDLHEVTYRAGH